MVFIFQFVNMVYHIDRFLYIEEYLHPWNKSNLIMAYELFDVLLKENSAELQKPNVEAEVYNNDRNCD